MMSTAVQVPPQMVETLVPFPQFATQVACSETPPPPPLGRVIQSGSAALFTLQVALSAAAANGKAPKVSASRITKPALHSPFMLFSLG